MTPPSHPNKRGRRWPRTDAPRTGGEEDQTPVPPISAIRAFHGFTHDQIALLQHAAQSFGQGLHHLLAQGVFCPTRGAILWKCLADVCQTRCGDVTLGFQYHLQAAVSSSGGFRGGGQGPLPPLSRQHPDYQQQQEQPQHHEATAMVQRLARDPSACVAWTRVTSAREITSCSKRMEKTFLSAQELRGMQGQIGIFAAYAWCKIIVPADRPRLMQALACAALERSSCIQVDTVVRCISRQGEIVRCLASVGFHAVHAPDREGGIQDYVLRLWPLQHQSLVVTRPRRRVAVVRTGCGSGSGRSTGGTRGRDGARRDDEVGACGLATVAAARGEGEGVVVNEEASQGEVWAGGPLLLRRSSPSLLVLSSSSSSSSPSFCPPMRDRNERQRDEEGAGGREEVVQQQEQYQHYQRQQDLHRHAYTHPQHYHSYHPQQEEQRQQQHSGQQHQTVNYFHHDFDDQRRQQHFPPQGGPQRPQQQDLHPLHHPHCHQQQYPYHQQQQQQHQQHQQQQHQHQQQRQQQQQQQQQPHHHHYDHHGQGHPRHQQASGVECQEEAALSTDMWQFVLEAVKDESEIK